MQVRLCQADSFRAPGVRPDMCPMTMKFASISLMTDGQYDLCYGQGHSILQQNSLQEFPQQCFCFSTPPSEHGTAL
ncbi:uncharacterized protein [Physcomitrium patens]|uniref:uncharacterized protein n=1 Tax=Physcomitrium patens TaxID=3218 RepID=UPI003CCDF496